MIELSLSFSGAPQQYSGYNQQPLNGGGTGVGYHPPPSYNRPLSAPGGHQGGTGGGGYMVPPASAAQGYSGKDGD